MRPTISSSWISASCHNSHSIVINARHHPAFVLVDRTSPWTRSATSQRQGQKDPRAQSVKEHYHVKFVWSTSREWFPACLGNALCKKMGSLQSTRKPLLLDNLSPRLDGTSSMPNTGHTSHTHRYVLPLLHQCDFHQRKDHGMGKG